MTQEPKSKCICGQDNNNHKDYCFEPTPPASSDWKQAIKEEWNNFVEILPMRVGETPKEVVYEWWLSKIYLALADQKKEIAEMVIYTLTEELDMKKMLEGWERYWRKAPNGRYIENCIECENTKKIITLITNL